MNKKELRYFDVARSVSQTSDFSRIKIGAVIVLNKEIIASSANIKKSHPIQMKLNALRFNDNHDTCKNYLHAEMDCIIKSKGYDLSKAKLFVYREDRMGNMSMSRPCEACMYAIKKSGIKTIYYTTANGLCKEDIL